MSEASERYYFAEKAMESFWSLYESEPDRQRIDLIRRLGFSATVTNFILDSDSYYIPNIRSGRLTRPKSFSKDAIPVVAVFPDEELEMTQPSLHDLQRDRLADQLKEKSWLNEAGLSVYAVNKHLEQTRLTAKLSASTEGCVTSALSENYPYRKNKDVLISGRPFIALNMSSEEPCPSVFAHEITHVSQRLDRPMQIFGSNRKRRDLKLSRLDDELESYAVQANMFWSVLDTTSGSMEVALKVNTLRKRYIGVSNYQSNKQLHMAIRSDSIARIILARDKVSAS